MNSLNQYLTPTYFIDSASPAIAEHARSIVGADDSDTVKAVKLYYAVRDGIRYNPYRTSIIREEYIASSVLARGDGFCVQKAVVLCALARASGVPCRLGFAIVKNHLITKRLREIMGTDLFVFHGFVEFLLNERWVKATPAFNLSLCEKFGVKPLDFDGTSDAVLHPFDVAGKRHMEYLHDYGSFADLPFEQMMEEYRKYYPAIVEMLGTKSAPQSADFEREAGDENRGGSGT